MRLGVAASVDEFLEMLRIDVIAGGESTRLVCITFERLPALKGLIEKVLAELATVALALWSNWYEGIVPFASIERSPFAFEDRLAEAFRGAGRVRLAPSLSWVESARGLCRSGRPPLTTGFPRAIQASQLALAIAPRDLLIVLSFVEREHIAGRLLGLARAAEWLGRATGARILVVVPPELAGSGELDGISFNPISPTRSDAIPPGRTEAQTVGVWPVLGHPHPYSPGEQLLARRLDADEMLGGLFRFNVRVETRFASKFLVDLLWPEGRVVVEVDGYEHHSNRLAFSLDRRRDYELLVSGYLVLRIPHDEVIDDVEVAIEKIRDLVLFRRREVGPQP